MDSGIPKETSKHKGSSKNTPPKYSLNGMKIVKLLYTLLKMVRQYANWSMNVEWWSLSCHLSCNNLKYGLSFHDLDHKYEMRCYRRWIDNSFLFMFFYSFKIIITFFYNYF